MPKPSQTAPISLTRRHAVAAAATAGLSALVPRAVATEGEIRIGQSVHLTGPLAPTITGVLKGQDLAIEEANRQGGVQGRAVRLITVDDAYDAGRCVDNCARLIASERVSALFALASTANVAAVLPLLTREKVPLIGTYSGAPSVRTPHHPYFFTVTASYEDEVVKMVRNLAMLQRRQIGLVYQDNAFGQQMVPVVDAAVRDADVSLAARAALAIDGANAAQAVDTMGRAQVQAVILMAFGPSMVPVVRALRARLAVPVYCISVSRSRALLDALGDDARGLAFTQGVPFPWQPVTPLTRDFHAAMARENMPIAFDCFMGYLTARVLVEGLRRAGRTVTPASIVTGMEGMRQVDVGGYRLSYSPTNHHGSRYVDITVVGPGGRFMR